MKDPPSLLLRTENLSFLRRRDASGERVRREGRRGLGSSDMVGSGDWRGVRDRGEMSL